MKLQNVNKSLKSGCTLRNEASEPPSLSHIRRLLLDYHDDGRWKYNYRLKHRDTQQRHDIASLALILAIYRDFNLNTTHPTSVKIKIARPCKGSVMTPRMTMKLLKIQKITGLKVAVL